MSRGSWEVLGGGDKSELGVGGNETLQTRGVPPRSCLVLVGHHKVTEVGSGRVFLVGGRGGLEGSGAALPAEVLHCCSHLHLLSKRLLFPRHPPKMKGRQAFASGW